MQTSPSTDRPCNPGGILSRAQRIGFEEDKQKQTAFHCAQGKLACRCCVYNNPLGCCLVRASWHRGMAVGALKVPFQQYY